MRRVLVSALVFGTVSMGCAAERAEAREDAPPTQVVQAQPAAQQQPQVRVRVEQKGYKEWQARQLAERRAREAQLRQAQAQRELAARRAAEAQERAAELERQAQSESLARAEEAQRADEARQAALNAQAELQQREEALRQAQAEQVRQQDELVRQRQELERREQLLQREQQARTDAELRARQALEQVASVKQEARGMVVTLNGSVLFAFDQAQLLPDAQRRLDVVANVLKQAPDQQFRVEGYTDAVGNDGYNLQLSQRRADSVKSYLISRGVAPDQIVSLGYGENRPVADNSSDEGRANNRRVEIVLPNEGTNQQGIGGSGVDGSTNQ